jgi:glycosyltransferase involved in cell wall biosynthesis
MKFTIGLPITKTAFLSKTLESIKKQIYSDFELIIRNNGKNDVMKNEIKLAVGDFINLSNVKYYESEEQLTMPNNFNKILEKAEGEFFVVMSDDDTMDENFLLEFDKLILTYPKTNVFHCRCRLINENEDFTGITEICPEWETQEDFVFHRINDRRLFYLSDFVAKTSALKKIGGFNTQCSGWGLDELTWSNLAAGNGIGYSSRVLLNYRMFTGNFTSSKENLKLRFDDIKLMYENFQKIINETCHISKSVYPATYMHKLNEERTQGQYDLIFQSYTFSSTLLEQFSFYFKNKNQFLAKRALKSVVKTQIEKLNKKEG